MLRKADDFAMQQTLHAASQMPRIFFIHKRAEFVGDANPSLARHASELRWQASELTPPTGKGCAPKPRSGEGGRFSPDVQLLPRAVSTGSVILRAYSRPTELHRFSLVTAMGGRLQGENACEPNDMCS